MRIDLKALLLGALSLVSVAAADEPVNAARPIAAHQALYIEELTWMEVRDRLLANDTTVILASGGVEANGPYTVLGKHNLLTERTVEQIARTLGHTLIAPIVRFVPQGEISPPTIHMRYPGTLTVSESTYRALVRESCESLASHGFNTVVLLGDSYGNQDGMREVAAELNAKWRDTQQRVYFIPEYYDVGGLKRWFAARGVIERAEGIHDDITYATMLMAIDPEFIRMKQRQAVGKFSINGVALEPVEAMQTLGREAIDHRVKLTVEAIRARLRADGRRIDMPLAPEWRLRYGVE